MGIGYAEVIPRGSLKMKFMLRTMDPLIVPMCNSALAASKL